MGIDLIARAGVKDIPNLPATEYEPGTGSEVGAPSSLLAWDPIAAKPRWRIKYQDAIGGGTVTTAGNLVQGKQYVSVMAGWDCILEIPLISTKRRDGCSRSCSMARRRSNRRPVSRRIP